MTLYLHTLPYHRRTVVMVKVAIAGATGHIGSQLVEALAAGKKHDIIVLSRAPNPLDETFRSLGAELRPISYSDPASLEKALAGVHTVVSTIFSLDPDVLLNCQLALLDAAKRTGVKRFVPSEFNVLGKHDDPIEMYRPKAHVSDAVRKSGLEYTLFENGIYMNYLATGTPGLGPASPINFVVNVGECTADIPGTGEEGVAYTRVQDIARFVAASLDLEKWPEVSRMAGEMTTYNKIVAQAETIRGASAA